MIEFEYVFAIFNSEKPGQCEAKALPAEACEEVVAVNECENDFECFGNAKCCKKGCSNVCVKPSAGMMIFFFQKKPPEVFCKKPVLKNFVMFTRKHLCWSLLSIKVVTLLKRDSNTGVFLCILQNV